MNLWNFGPCFKEIPLFSTGHFIRTYSMLGQLAWVLELVFLLVALWLLLVGAALHTRCRRLFPLVGRRERSWGVGRCPWHDPSAILHAHLLLSGQLNPRVESSPRSITCYQRQSVSKTQRVLYYHSRIFEVFLIPQVKFNRAFLDFSRV